jgi:ABC transport system ATP-binding/permease protein
VLDRAELAVSPGERIALVGRNGSGKSTLMAIASGALAAEGERFVQPGTRFGWLAQAPDFGGHVRVLDYAAEAAAPLRAQAVLQRLGLSAGAPCRDRPDQP